MAHPDEMYVGIGATGAEEVHAAGVDLLDPIALERLSQDIGTDEVAGPAVGDRFGCSVLVNLLRLLAVHNASPSGTLTIAFATQQWTGGRGLDRLLNEFHPDEVIYVARTLPPRIDESKQAPAPTHDAIAPGSGVLIGTSDASAPLSGLAAELKQIGDQHHVAIQAVVAHLRPLAGYAKSQPWPSQFAQLGVPSLYPVTPADTISTADVSALQTLLYRYITGKDVPGSGGSISSSRNHLDDLQLLTETYGASGHEEAVREQVKKLLPNWAKPETDAAGNLILKMGSAKTNSNAPKLVFIAHMDEIGYQVRSIEPDGRLLMDVLGGGYTEYFLQTRIPQQN
jgi:putative aminopeptidase